MRRIVGLFALFVSIMLVVPCFGTPVPPYPKMGLVGCWSFDEGSGVTAVDSSGIGNHGLIVNATYTGDDIPPQSQSGYSLIFNNTQSGNAYSYVTVPDNSSLRPNSGLTLAAWVKTNAVQQRACIIIGKQYGSIDWRDSYNLWYEWGLLNFYVKSQTSENRIFVAQPPTNEWHHVVGTYDGSFMRLYVDGVEQVNGTLTGSIDYTDNPVSIGADSDRADHTLEQGWNGLIDEVLIYNRSLTQAEILQIIPEFPSVLMLPLFMSATIIGVIAYTWRRRKQANSPFFRLSKSRHAFLEGK